MKITKFKSKLIDCGAVALIVAAFYIFKVPCLFKLIFKIPCPGCGMTRAFISLFCLDLSGAFFLNPMVFSLPLLVLFYFTDGKLFKKGWLNALLLGLITVGFFVNWILRLIAL